MKTSNAQKRALDWLRERNGSGALSHPKKGGKRYLVAGGETAPFMPETWAALEANGLVTIADGRVTVKQ